MDIYDNSIYNHESLLLAIMHISKNTYNCDDNGKRNTIVTNVNRLSHDDTHD